MTDEVRTEEVDKKLGAYLVGRLGGELTTDVQNRRLRGRAIIIEGMPEGNDINKIRATIVSYYKSHGFTQDTSDVDNKDPAFYMGEDDCNHFRFTVISDRDSLTCSDSDRRKTLISVERMYD